MKIGAASAYRMHPASAEALEAIGVRRPDDPIQEGLKSLDRFNNRALTLFLEICSKCGLCAPQCHTYLGTGDPKNIPAGRADLLRKVYKHHFSASGKVFGRLVGAVPLSREMLEDWYRYFYQCNGCRRCAVFCPFGIDTSELTAFARQVLTCSGMAPKYIVDVVANVQKNGNGIGIPEATWRSNCAFLEEEIKDETGQAVNIPIDREAEILYIPPSADLFVTADTMIGVAKTFHAAKASWTVSTRAGEAGNFGLFFDAEAMKALNRRIVDEVGRLKATKVIFGECGHGWRVAKKFTRELNSGVKFEIANILEYTADLIAKGRLTVDPGLNTRPVTYHDPCNMARSAGLLDEPREILSAVVQNFIEMTPNREKSFCCGGGGGLLTDELLEFRMKAGKAKAESVRATRAEIVAAPCAICKAQLPRVMAHYGLDVQVAGVMDLVGNAIVI